LFRRRLWLLALIFNFALTANAQRRYSLGATANLTGGGTNSLPGVGVGQGASEPVFLTYGAFPSINLTSTGAHSLLNASYSFGFNRTTSYSFVTRNRTGQNVDQQSHTASLHFSKTFSPDWKIDLTDAFTSSSNPATFNAFRNIATEPAAAFVFSPVTTQIVSRGNTATAGATYQYTDRSSLSFTMAHNFLDYGSGSSSPAGALLNQQRFSGDMAYNYKSGKQESWTLGYDAGYFNFLQSENAYSQSARIGYSNNIFRDFKLSLMAGVSDTQVQGASGSYIGYNSSASLGKTINNNLFRLYYAQTSGESSGLGTISNTRRAGLSLNHASQRTTQFVDVSAFDTQGILGNAYSIRGASATASFGVVLTREWSVQVGGMYQKYEPVGDSAINASSFSFTQKNVFVSLRYNNPTLWSGLR
jgi:hypothetical protein